MRFSIPHNGDPDFWPVMDAVLGSWSDIESVYTAPNPALSPTGRKAKIASHIRRDGDALSFDSQGYDAMLLDFAAAAARRGVGVNILLNGSVLPTRREEFLEQLDRLRDTGGLRAFTVGTWEWLAFEPWRECFPGVEVHNSVYMGLRDVDAALRSIDAGITTFLLPPEANRDPGRVAAFRQALPVKIKLMVNEGCLPLCPFRARHQHAAATYALPEVMQDIAYSRSPDLRAMGCRGTFERHPEAYLKNTWVRPEDIGEYESLVDILKIVGRSFDTTTIGAIVAAYRTRSFDGDLRSLVEVFKHVDRPLRFGAFSEQGWRHVRTCSAALGDCPLCREAAEALWHDSAEHNCPEGLPHFPGRRAVRA